jgi:hypothetical protein
VDLTDRGGIILDIYHDHEEVSMNTITANIEIIDPGYKAPNNRLYGVSVTCEAPKRCAVPETCKHVRAALRARADAPVYAHIFEQTTVIGPEIKTRIPLGEYVWASVIINKNQALVLRKGEAPLIHLGGFVLGEHGMEDLKWQLINYAANAYDQWQHTHIVPFVTTCPICYTPNERSIDNEPDFAWVLHWAAFDRSTAPCYACIRAHAQMDYMTRFPDTPVHSELW